MSVAVITGAGGLVGSACAALLAEQGLEVMGVDNDLRRRFFGEEASTRWRVRELERTVPGYRPHDFDIRDGAAVNALFADAGRRISAVVHAAAQPSHDWAASDPLTDFGVNAVGTLNLLEAARRHCPQAPFVFLSTNKVYGDAPNRLPMQEHDTRWEIDPRHPYAGRGVDETLSIDRSTHSLFGVSKAAADLMVQEYGRYFGLPTACLRGGCLTGGGHSAAQTHGFLAYLMACVVTGRPYVVQGHKAKQVRDILHAGDLARAIWRVIEAPRCGAVYNMGGGRASNCSMLEAIALCEGLAGRRLDWTYADAARTGDHVWWISDISAFQHDYPGFAPTLTLEDTAREICEAGRRRWLA